jgi:hypothetical protein
MTRNIVVTTATIAAIAIVAAAAVPFFVTPAFAQFNTSNSASQSATQTGTATGGAGVFGNGGSASVDQGVCQQIAQSGAFGSSSNQIGFSDCS